MPYFQAALVFVFALFLSACDSEGIDPDRFPGPHGEPPKALKLAYERQFVAEEKNYFRSLGEIHAFILDNGLYPKYSKCLTDVLDIRITADFTAHNEAFPCLLVSAGNGDIPKIYLIVTINDVMFNQLDENNRLVLTVGIYGDEKNEATKKFVAQIEQPLMKLYEMKTQVLKAQ